MRSHSPNHFPNIENYLSEEIHFSKQKDEKERLTTVECNGMIQNLIKIMMDNNNIQFKSSNDIRHDSKFYSDLISFVSRTRGGVDTIVGQSSTAIKEFTITEGSNFIHTNVDASNTSFKKVSSQGWNCYIEIPIKKSVEVFSVYVKNTGKDRSGIFFGVGGSSFTSNSYWSLISTASSTGVFNLKDVTRDPLNKYGYPVKHATYDFHINKSLNEVKIYKDGKIYETSQKLNSLSNPIKFSVMLYYIGNEVVIKRKTNSVSLNVPRITYDKLNLLEYYDFFRKINCKEGMGDVCHVLMNSFSITNPGDVDILITYFLNSFRMYEMENLKLGETEKVTNNSWLSMENYFKDAQFKSAFTYCVYLFLKEHPNWNEKIQIILFSNNPTISLVLCRIKNIYKFTKHPELLGYSSNGSIMHNIYQKRKKSIFEEFNVPPNLSLVCKDSKHPIKVHKEILVYNTNFFNIAFKNGWLKESTESFEIEVFGDEELRVLIKFLYTGEIKLEKVSVLFNLVRFSVQFFEYSLQVAVLKNLLETLSMNNDFRNQILEFGHFINAELPQPMQEVFFSFWKKQVGNTTFAEYMEKSLLNKKNMKKENELQVQIMNLKQEVKDLRKKNKSLEKRVETLENIILKNK